MLKFRQDNLNNRKLTNIDKQATDVLNAYWKARKSQEMKKSRRRDSTSRVGGIKKGARGQNKGGHMSKKEREVGRVIMTEID